jgi:hypothetical protein
VYLGTYNSGAAKLSMPITNEAGIAQISPANSYAGLTRACETCAEGEPDIYRPSGELNYFRVAATDDVQGPAAASWAVCLGAKKVFIIDDAQAYGAGIANEFSATPKKSASKSSATPALSLPTLTRVQRCSTPKPAALTSCTAVSCWTAAAPASFKPCMTKACSMPVSSSWAQTASCRPR